MKNDQRIIFWGSPEFAADILERLISEKLNIVAVVTQPDKKVGRKQEISELSVKKIALKNKIKIFQPEKLKDEKFAGEIKQLKSDLAIVAAYGKIIPKNILDIPRRGSINIHASLLPKYRGASPIQNAIIVGDKKTGVTLMLMDAELDAGAIISQKEIKIKKDETAEQLARRLSSFGSQLLTDVLDLWLRNKIKIIPQDNKQASYSKIIKRRDGEINWSESAEQIYRKYRAYYPWPGSYSLVSIKGIPKRIKLTKIKLTKDDITGERKAGKIIEFGEKIAVRTGEGLIVVEKAQIEGKKELQIKEITAGYPELIGSIFQRNLES